MSIVFRENIVKVMSDKSISQVYLESTSGISRQTISKLVQTLQYNHYDIRLSTALSITQALDVDFPSLFFRLNSMEIKQLSSFVIKDYLCIFRENIKRYILEKRKTQKSLSSEPGVKESTISELLSGDTSDPYLSSLLHISRVIDIDMNKLFMVGGVW